MKLSNIRKGTLEILRVGTVRYKVPFQYNKDLITLRGAVTKFLDNEVIEVVPAFFVRVEHILEVKFHEEAKKC